MLQSTLLHGVLYVYTCSIQTDMKWAALEVCVCFAHSPMAHGGQQQKGGKSERCS